MGPGASAVGPHWGSVPVVGPPPLAIAIAVGLVSIGLLAAPFLIDALAARDRRQLARPTAAAPAVEVARPPPPAVDGAVRAELAFPDLAAAEIGQLALARLRRFAAVADEAAVGDDVERQRLARWAIFSAYRDCVALGLGGEAQALLHSRSGRARALADDLSRTA